jgi:hypothetical protein
MSDTKGSPFANKGNAVSDSEIKQIVDHPGGKWGPSGDGTQLKAPPENLKSE